MLRRHEECSDLFGDVLNVIENRLLRRKQEERAGTNELVETFQAHYDKCLKDEAYCTARGRKVPTPAATHQPDAGEKSWARRARTFFWMLTGCFWAGDSHHS